MRVRQRVRQTLYSLADGGNKKARRSAEPCTTFVLYTTVRLFVKTRALIHCFRGARTASYSTRCYTISAEGLFYECANLVLEVCVSILHN